MVKCDSGTFLITNWHVVSGRNPLTGVALHPSAAWPDEMLVYLRDATPDDEWRWSPQVIPLHDANGTPLWLEHPTHRQRVDVVGIAMADLAGTRTYPYDLSTPSRPLAYGASRSLSIIGFPFG